MGCHTISKYYYFFEYHYFFFQPMAVQRDYVSRALHFRALSREVSLWAGKTNFGPITLSLLQTIFFMLIFCIAFFYISILLLHVIVDPHCFTLYFSSFFLILFFILSSCTALYLLYIYFLISLFFHSKAHIQSNVSWCWPIFVRFVD